MDVEADITPRETAAERNVVLIVALVLVALYVFLGRVVLGSWPALLAPLGAGLVYVVALQPLRRVVLRPGRPAALALCWLPACGVLAGLTWLALDSSPAGAIPCMAAGGLAGASHAAILLRRLRRARSPNAVSTP